MIADVLIQSSLANTPPSPFRDALSDWIDTDGVAWVYILKAATAAILALLVEMRLNLPQPRTAMTMVFILMQLQSGMVLAKSFRRFCGTMVGLAVVLVLTAFFGQQPVEFLAATSVWIAICTAGAARNRNFRSYGILAMHIVLSLRAALSSTEQAIDSMWAIPALPRPPRDEHQRLQRILSHLHFIRTALPDLQSPFLAFADGSSSRNKGATNAA
jgi:hypothetical protein